MELSLKIHNKNSHALRAVLIKGTSPKGWLLEMQRMGLSLDNVAYAIPSAIPNVLFGCLVVLKMDSKIADLGRNVYLQGIGDILFIPLNTILFPNIQEGEMATVLNGTCHLLHPEIGLFELSEPITWMEILDSIKRVAIKITTPLKGIAIPAIIQSLRVEVDEKELLKAIEDPITKEEGKAQLLFNMQKLLAGNDREMEKFLAYMEKNPEAALKYALPLDTMGISRRNNMGRFSFRESSFLKTFLSPNGFFSGSGMPLKIVIGFIFFQVLRQTPDFFDSLSDGISASQIIITLFIVTIGVMCIFLLRKSIFSIHALLNVKKTLLLLGILLISVVYIIYPLYNAGRLTSFSSILILVLLVWILYRLFNSNKTILKR